MTFAHVIQMFRPLPLLASATSEFEESR